MGRLLTRLRRLRLLSLNRDEQTSAAERPVENTDALSAAHSGRELDSGGEGGGIPPNYVKSYDEGRPRH
ncbi:MAG: hypothetical protein M3O73_07940 [Actinomycetota bacterium]|nr:hypothetical protein [Actinomycetota bacterium]